MESKEEINQVNNSSKQSSSSSGEEEEEEEIVAFDPVSFLVEEARLAMKTSQEVIELCSHKPYRAVERVRELTPYGVYQVEVVESYNKLLATAPELSHYYESVLSTFKRRLSSVEARDIECKAFIKYLEMEREKHLKKRAKLDAIHRYVRHVNLWGVKVAGKYSYGESVSNLYPSDDDDNMY